MIGISLKPLPAVEMVAAKRFIQQPDRAETIELVSGPVPTKMNDGSVVMVETPDAVMSVQPDGTVQGRVPGTAGRYERQRRSADKAVFCPDGQHVYAFACVEKLP